MDMAINNLFKHKVRFELCGHDSSWDEPDVPNKGYHYSSPWIENGESVGIRSACDLYIDKLKPLFLHIISTMYHEAEMEISSINITVSVTDYEECNDYDIVKYEFTSAPNDVITNYSRSWVYPFPEGLLNKKIYIGIESYVFMVDDNVREMNAYYEEEAENGIIEPLGPPEETYEQERCVICLESTPNILFLECGHIALCEDCEKRKRSSNLSELCDVCRSPVSRRLRIKKRHHKFV